MDRRVFTVLYCLDDTAGRADHRRSCGIRGVVDTRQSGQPLGFDGLDSDTRFLLSSALVSSRVHRLA